MSSRVHWVELSGIGRLAIMARPRAGDWLEDEIEGWRVEGINVIVSLLENEESAELDLQEEAHGCRARGLEFISFPIPDRGVPPSLREATALVRTLAKRINGGKAVAVHCRAGIGRSSLIAACVLAELGIEPNSAFERIGTARGLTVPDTAEQRDWVTAFRDAAAGKVGD